MLMQGAELPPEQLHSNLVSPSTSGSNGESGDDLAPPAETASFAGVDAAPPRATNSNEAEIGPGIHLAVFPHSSNLRSNDGETEWDPFLLHKLTDTTTVDNNQESPSKTIDTEGIIYPTIEEGRELRLEFTQQGLLLEY